MVQQLSKEARPNAGAFAIEVARLLADTKCENVAVLDVRGLSQVTGYLVVATGTSDRQMHSVAEDVGELGDEHGFPVFRKNEERASTWTIVDFVDVTVHLMEPNARAFYDIEHLWTDAKRVAWQRDGGQSSPGRADHDEE